MRQTKGPSGGRMRPRPGAVKRRQGKVTPAVMEEILNLLRTTTLRHIDIAKQVGVSRGSIGIIARRERLYESRPAAAPIAFRCPGCHGMIYEKPCRLCEAKAWIARQEIQDLLGYGTNPKNP